MYGNSDFENLLRDIASVESVEDFEIAEINKKLTILISLDSGKTSLSRGEIITQKELFFKELLSLRSEQIAFIINRLTKLLPKDFSELKIIEFSRELVKGDKDKIAPILNALNAPLKTKFFRKIIHGDLEATIFKTGNADEIIAMLNALDQPLQALLFTEINFINNRNFFEELLFFNISQPRKLSQILSGLTHELKVMLFTQKNHEEKTFFDRFFKEFLVNPQGTNKVLDCLGDDLKMMVFTARDEVGHNSCESAVIEIFHKFRSAKHEAVIALHTLKNIQKGMLQLAAQSHSKLEDGAQYATEIVDVKSFYEAALAIDMLERIYKQSEGAVPNTSGNLDLIYDTLINSETAQNPKYKVFLKALDIIKLGEISGGNVYILDANHADHNAYFVVKCGKNNHPITISYIDGWRGIFGKNSSNYSFGEVEFEVDPSKVASIEDLSKKLSKALTRKLYPSKEEMNQALLGIVKCDEKEIPIIVRKNIPTEIQKRNNCHLKSTLLAMRAVAEIIDPTLKYLVNGREWSAELEEAGFLEFDDKALSGAGRDLYKGFRNDFIDEQIATLLDVSRRDLPRSLSIAVSNCLENIKEKTEKKQVALMTEFSKLGEFTSDRQSELSDIYNKRLQTINESIANMQKEAMPLSNPRLDSKGFSYVRLVSVPQKESTF